MRSSTSTTSNFNLVTFTEPSLLPVADLENETIGMRLA